MVACLKDHYLGTDLNDFFLFVFIKINLNKKIFLENSPEKSEISYSFYVKYSKYFPPQYVLAD